MGIAELDDPFKGLLDFLGHDDGPGIFAVATAKGVAADADGTEVVADRPSCLQRNLPRRDEDGCRSCLAGRYDILAARQDGCRPGLGIGKEFLCRRTGRHAAVVKDGDGQS